jgi:hypothetical protein
MIIQTPGPDKTVIEKTVQVGGGVVIQVPGTLYRATVQVLEIDESDQSVRVKGVGFEGWATKAQIKDVQDPSTYAIDHAINVIGNQ